jgi:hypothetical protein
MNIREKLRSGRWSPLPQSTIYRPDRDEEWLKQQDYAIWPHFSEYVQSLLEDMRSDIDHGASGRRSIVTNSGIIYNHPDEESTCCTNCGQRIASHNGNTAFVLGVAKHEDVVGMSVCCEICSQLDDEELMRRLVAAARKKSRR